MNVKVENIEKNVVQLDIEVDAAKFEEGMQKSYLKNVKKFSVPGFRKGKVPRNIVEMYYGEQVLYEDAINYVCAEAYDNAISENNIIPVDSPKIDIKQIGKGKNLIFTATVTVKPEVELGQYKMIEVEKAKVNITDEDVEKELQKVAEKNARLVNVEDRPVQSGDTVIIDFEGFIDGKPFEGGKGQDYSLVIGSGQFIPGFEEQLIGANKGDEVDVNVTFPEDYGYKDVAGKPALFKVKINEIKLKELPAIDDEFAKDVSEFDTLEEYKASLKAKLVESAEQKARREAENKIIQKVVDNATVDIPQVMINRQIDSQMRDLEIRLRYQGMELQKYLDIMGMKIEDLRSGMAESAKNVVKIQLVIEKIGIVESIVATEDEVNEEIGKLAESYKQNVEEFKKHLRAEDIEYIKNNLVFRKTIDFLFAQAIIK